MHASEAAIDSTAEQLKREIPRNSALFRMTNNYYDELDVERSYESKYFHSLKCLQIFQYSQWTKFTNNTFVGCHRTLITS